MQILSKCNFQNRWAWLKAALNFSLCAFLLTAVNAAFALDMLPAWVSTPNQDSGSSLWGVGSGEDLETAKKNALTDIAGKFNTRVKETVEQYYKQNATETESSLEITTQAEVAATELSDFQVTRSEQIGQTVWAEVQLDREKYGKKLLDKYNHQHDQLAQEMDQLTSLSSLEQLIKAPELVERIKKLELSAVQVQFASEGFSAKEKLNYYNQCLNSLDKIQSSSSVVVIASNTPNQFSNLLIEQLTSSGIKVNEAKKQGDSEIRLNSQFKSEKDSRGAYLYKITLEITSLDQLGKVLGKSTHMAKGRSYENENNAIDKAVSSMKYGLGKKSLDSLLKLSI